MMTLGAAAQTVTGSGTANYLPKFTGSTTLSNSIISQGSGNNLVGIGTTTPRATLDIVRQCASNNLAAILVEQDILSSACSGGQSYGTDYMVIRQFNSLNSTYQHYFYVNGNGRIALGNNAAATQLDVQALSSNDPFQLRNNAGTSLFRVAASGNIGVRTTSPVGPLDIRNSANATLMQLSNTGNLSVGNITPAYRLDVNCQQTGNAQPPFRFTNYQGNVNMVCTNADRIGINVANPDTYGGSLVVGAQGTGANALDLISIATSGWSNQLRFQSASGIRHLITDDRTNNYLLIKTGSGGGANAKLRIEGNQDLIGNLVVNGTFTVLGSSVNQFKVYSDGKVRAREVQVDLQTIPDYVFSNEYKLRTIDELDEYLVHNKHLPNVPSEAEYSLKGGIDIGELNMRLLEKIEELSLYIIQLNNRIKKIENEN